MKLFELNYSWYEDYRPYLFFHTDKTKEQFEQDCITCLKNNYKELFNDEDGGWIGTSEIVSVIADNLSKMGYIPAVKEGVYGLFGSNILRKEDRDFKELKKVFGSGIFNRIEAHNKEMEERLNKRS